MLTRIVNDDSEPLQWTFEMFIYMLIAAFEMLSEHNLTADDSTKPISDVDVVTEFLLKVLEDDAKSVGYRLQDVKEILRIVDKYGVKLVAYKQVSLKERRIEKLRKACKGVPKRNNWKTDVS